MRKEKFIIFVSKENVKNKLRNPKKINNLTKSYLGCQFEFVNKT